MLNKILGTTGAKIISAVLGFLLISINAKVLGAAVLGTLALLILGITIVLLFSSLGGGAALVYLAPRYNISKLYLPSFLWSIMSPVMVSPILQWVGWIPEELTLHLLLLSILKSINQNHATILLGKEEIRKMNVIAVAEIVLLLALVAVLYYGMGAGTIESYINALYISYGFNTLISAWSIRKFIRWQEMEGSAIIPAFKAIFRYSFFIQSAAFFQLMNYRLSYYFLEYFSGKAAVGIYHVGARLSESVWIVSRSISTVQYARISNTEDHQYTTELTARIFRFSLVVSILMTALLLALPTTLYTWIFSPQFAEIKIVLAGMAIGIVSLGCSMAFSGYFSGVGKQHLNMTGSLIGLVFTLGGGWLLIPTYGLMGAAVTASISYTATNLFYTFFFIRISKLKFRAFIPKVEDFVFLIRKWRERS